MSKPKDNDRLPCGHPKECATGISDFEGGDTVCTWSCGWCVAEGGLEAAYLRIRRAEKLADAVRAVLDARGPVRPRLREALEEFHDAEIKAPRDGA